MPLRRVLTSFSHAACLEKTLDHVDTLAGRSEILVLAATRGAADEFARACGRARGGLFGVHRRTLTQLAAELAAAALAERDLAPVSRLGLEALAARAVFACRHDGGLGYFEPVADTPGFPTALASTFTELRLNRVDRDRLAASGAPGRDLARLLSRYEKELADRSLADQTVLFALAARVDRHRLLDLPLLLLDVPLDSKSEQALVAALVARSPDVLATALVGDSDGIRTLERILGVAAEPVDNGDTATTLSRLRRYVFSLDQPPAGKPDATVEFFSAPGEGLECVEIARRILALSRDGIGFDQAAVLLRHPEAYLPLIEDAFRRAGIPGYFSRGVARPDPAGRAFLALLGCAIEGLSASRFAEYLSLGQAPATDASGAPPDRPPDWVPPEDDLLSTLKIPPLSEEAAEPEEGEDSPVIAGSLRVPFAWEKLLVDAAVIGGRDRWFRRLRGLEQEYRVQLSELESPDDAHYQYLQRQIERLGHLQRFALPLIDALASLPASATWEVWLDRLAELAAKALKNPDSVLSLLNELRPMDQVGPVDLEEVSGVLAERLRFLRQEPRGRRYGKVFVGSIAEARARCFQIVFLPGLAEGLFPRKAFEDPLLLDVYRRPLDAGLEIQANRAARERLLLRIAAGAARSRFIASYPLMDVTQARPRVPSFYALEIWRAAEGRLPQIREMEKRAVQAAPSRLGWPAPDRTTDAIDDAEYDLAFLNGLLHQGRRPARGGARYLLAANAHLARSLRTRGRRWRNFWSEADGIVDPDRATLEVLATHGLNARSYSPTALQQFAACPYRFLLYAIHQLRCREEAVAIEQMDPLTRGALFHEAQFELFRELAAAGLLPIRAAAAPQILDVADRVLDRVAARYEEKLAPAIPRVWASEVEQVRIDLRGWIFELASTDDEWRPIHFEFAFGLAPGPGRDPRSAPGEATVLDGMHLRGSVDLIERHPTSGVLRVIDHKTGKAPPRPPVWIGNGEVLQPLLYGLAAENLLGEKVESGMLFYATQRGGYQRFEISLDQNARRRIAFAAGKIDEAIREGFLPAAPRPQACEYCDYRPACGPYEELRVRRKKQDRLDSLLQLRSMP